MSISISRGPLDTNFLPPIFFSISRKARNNMAASKFVSASTAQFKNHGCSRKSTGSVSLNDETIVNATHAFDKSFISAIGYPLLSTTVHPSENDLHFSSMPIHLQL